MRGVNFVFVLLAERKCSRVQVVFKMYVQSTKLRASEL